MYPFEKTAFQVNTRPDGRKDLVTKSTNNNRRLMAIQESEVYIELIFLQWILAAKVPALLGQSEVNW